MRVIGLISGTSADGVDGVMADIDGEGYILTVRVLGGKTRPYSKDLRHQIFQVMSGGAMSLPELAALDDAIAQTFARTAIELIAEYGATDLIGSHGQTLFHRPPQRGVEAKSSSLGYSLQLGRGDLIADLTQCPTVSNFRQADIALGGEGAPLVPPVDLALLTHPTRSRCVQNIGGIGNVTQLPPWDKTQSAWPPNVLGWDTGPGNSLLDLAVTHFSTGRYTFDRDGAWAAQGMPCVPLVDQWLEHPYFEQSPPKSTGRELFGRDFLSDALTQAGAYQLTPADVLATLTEFTVQSIALSYHTFLPDLPSEILVCGGGVHNGYLMSRLRHHLPDTVIRSTSEVGVPSDLKEALAFAVLAYWRSHHFPSNLPSVTGAKASVSLGECHAAPLASLNR
jgi:anhydro-N-acetylmuramic acid kinase